MRIKQSENDNSEKVKMKKKSKMKRKLLQRMKFHLIQIQMMKEETK
jgi:hypothetical protein